MDLALNNLQGLIYHKNQPTNQPTNQPGHSFCVCEEGFYPSAEAQTFYSSNRQVANYMLSRRYLSIYLIHKSKPHIATNSFTFFCDQY